jgi:glyoxylase-like metal-dependent hydrolase (beta-lactamase superfamily II)
MTPLPTDSLAPPVGPLGSGQAPPRSSLHYPLQEQLPDLGSALEVAPGVFWLRMGLPFALNHINLWLFRDRLPHPSQSGVWQEGWTAVDCGVDNPATRDRLGCRVEAQVLQGLPILRVLVTHMHPDHMGLAHWLCERWQAPLWMSTSEYQSALLACHGLSNFGGDPTVQFFQRPWLEQSRRSGRGEVAHGLLPQHGAQGATAAYVRLMSGMPIRIGDRIWQCISGYGHSPEHMALLDAHPATADQRRHAAAIHFDQCQCLCDGA